ncbi:MAG: hypothetical protein IJT96_08550 [Lachnospiraceae bacterium]|nr:hypothetical protein [Lachnospiraceae bacterium]
MKRFIMSDRWYLEESKAWFTSTIENILFEVELAANEARCLSKVPEEEDIFRKNPICFKHDDSIYCLPDRGKKIWRYYLSDNRWESIDCWVQEEKRLSVRYLKLGGDNYALMNVGKRDVAILDGRRGEILDTIHVSPNEDEALGWYFCKDGLIWWISQSSPNVYLIDIASGKVERRHLGIDGTGYCTISYGNGNVWVSGREKRIYKLDEELNLQETYELSDGFGTYHFCEKTDILLDCEMKDPNMPAFIESVSVGGKIWFVPLYTNQLVYIDTEDGSLGTFDIDYEEEDATSAYYRIMCGKYMATYVRDNRYLVLFSIKNEWLIEIDTLEMDYRILDMTVDYDGLRECCEELFLSEFYCECKDFTVKDYFCQLQNPRYKFQADLRNGMIR